MVTRADVARMAGVSPAVVSYVINDGPRPVSKAARARVVAAIEALDYRPNAIASALRGGSTRAVGLLVPSTISPYFAELTDIMERELYDSGNLLSVCITDDDASREVVHLQSLADRRVDGILLISSTGLDSVRAARIAPPPIVMIDRVSVDSSVPSVSVDNTADAAYAVEHLQSWGHTHIACIAGPWPIPLSAQRVDGWRAQQGRIGAPNSADLVVHTEFTSQGGLDAALALLGPESRPMAVRGSRPTAVFVSSDAQAYGVLQACDQLGLRVPEDLSIVSFDGTQAARFSRPPLTTMRQPVRDIGLTSVRLLLGMIAGTSTAPDSVVYRSNLVLGGSCAPYVAPA